MTGPLMIPCDEVAVAKCILDIVVFQPPEIFDLKAESTVRMWKFSPASYDGKAVKVWATQQIAFKLE